jgi:type IV secretory pathway TraG/TraD family ATPase VirD4
MGASADTHLQNAFDKSDRTCNADTDHHRNASALLANFKMGEEAGMKIIAKTEVARPIELGQILQMPMARSVICILLLFVVASLMRDSRGSEKRKLARSRMGGKADAAAAKKTAFKQMREKKHNKVSLCTQAVDMTEENYKAKPGAMFVTDAQRGIAAIGASSSGKTYSVIDPLIRSSIQQGFPTIIYDFKYPEQSSKIVAYAAKQGYEVNVFAPGFKESGVCNVLDFMSDGDDGLMARQIGASLTANLNGKATAHRDEFFGDAGDQLMQALMMLAKGLPEPDLMTAALLASLDKLPERILKAKERCDKEGDHEWKLSTLTYMAFSQVIQLRDSEKTVSGVIGTAQRVFSRFLVRELIATLCGQTTIPIEMEGKQLLIIGMDQTRRDAVAPLLATVLQMVVNHNLYGKDRKDPLILCLDELDSLYLPSLKRWITEGRFKGLCTMVGFQNIGQIEESYGKGILQTILGGCGTKIILNPQDKASAEYFSSYLGEEGMDIRQSSRSRGRQSSTTISSQLNKRPLVEVAALLKYPIGKAIFINPGYSSRKEAYVPIIGTIQIPKGEAAISDQSEALWPKVCKRLIDRAKQSSADPEIIVQRRRSLEKLFSLEGGVSRQSNQASGGIGGNTKNELLRKELAKIW